MISRDEAHRLVDAAFDHLEREAKVNSDGERDAQQEAALTVIRDFLDLAGWKDLMQRRLVTFIQGKPKGSQSEASELAGLIKTTRNFRRAEARLQYDLRLLPESRKAIWSMVAAEDGYDGDHGGGGIYEPDPRAGVDREGGGEILKFKTSLVDKIGYTAGARGSLDTRRINDLLLLRAVRAWGRTPNDPVSAETIRGWCTRSGRLADVFDKAYEDGRRDKAAGKIDKKRLVPD